MRFQEYELTVWDIRVRYLLTAKALVLYMRTQHGRPIVIGICKYQVIW